MKKITKVDPYWMAASEVLAGWLEKKGIALLFSKEYDNEFSPDGRYVNIRPIKNKEEMFYTLLHECGHILVEANDKGFKDNYKTKDFHDWNKMVATRDSALKVSVLADEMEAWNRGRKLAGRLGLAVNDKAYKKLAGQCIWAYACFMAR
tara:strand:- start:268 stop:714 length:447 start_codon:yes stop_codon:yes gene_type:complete